MEAEGREGARWIPVTLDPTDCWRREGGGATKGGRFDPVRTRVVVLYVIVEVS